MTQHSGSRLPPFISLLLERLNLRSKTTHPQTGLVVHEVDLSTFLYFGGVDALACIEISPGLTNDDDQYFAYRELIGKPGWRSRLKLLMVPSPSSELLSRLRQLDNTVLITGEDVARLTQSRSLIRPLRELFRTQLALSALAPYQYSGAVTGNKFFGRDIQLNLIMRNPENSYLVTGTRMSGKTSLLMEAKRRLGEANSQEHPPSSSTNAIYVDCKRYSTVAGFINAALVDMDDRSSFSKIERWESPSRWPEFFRYLRATARRAPHKRLHMFLDEYDSIVDIDKHAEIGITWNFRSLQQTNSAERGIIQFVIAGSKRLAQLADDDSSAFYNFVDHRACRLDNFDLGTVQKVLQRPMEDLGFTLEDPALVTQELLHETAGRPSSVQYVCAHLLTQLGKLKKNTVTVSLIRQIVQAPDYLQYYEGTLHENTGVLEKFILCSQATEPAPYSSFSQEDILAILKTKFNVYIDPAVLFRSLEDLNNSGFINLDDRFQGELRYEIAVPVIKRIYRRFPLDSYIPLLTADGTALPLRKAGA